MKIFREIELLKKRLGSHKNDYSNEYLNGYRDALSDLEESLKDKITLEVKQ